MRFAFLVVLLVPAAAPQAGPDRSPHDLALSPDGRWALTANATSDTVSLVDLTSDQVVAEVPAGRRPFAIDWRGSTAVVTNWLSDSVTILDVAPPKLSAIATVSAGDEPRGVAIGGGKAYVALSGEDAVAIIDLDARKVLERLPAGDEPWHLALTPDGKRLAVSCALSQDVRVFDVSSLKLLHRAAMRGHNLRRLAMAPDGSFAYLGNIAERGMPTSKDNIDRGWVVGNRLSRVPILEEGPREAISLDPRGKGVADVDGVAVSPDGKALVLAAGGSHEVILLRTPLPFLAFGGPGDHIDREVLADAKRFRRLPIGGRPVAVAFASDGRTVAVANYLSNAVQIVDFEKGVLVKTVSIGGPAKPSPARLGEAIFYDAQRSFNQWYSCHTCHADGHTNGSTFDTLNDGKYGNLKKTLSLRGVSRTGPWTWHGWQGDFQKAVAHSMKTTMQMPEPQAPDVELLATFLSTLDFAPPPGPRNEAAARGEALFKVKSCDTCHAPPDYTAPETFFVGLEAPDDAYKGFNPPTLRGSVTRGPWLHDGRAKTLEDLFNKHHRPLKLTNKPDFTPEELKDLIAFLRTL